MATELTDLDMVPPDFGPTAKPGQSKSETFEQYYHNFLYQNGMFPAQVAAVLDSVRNVESFRETFPKAHAGYPLQMYAVLDDIIRRATLEWIDNNLPEAWFRAMFE